MVKRWAVWFEKDFAENRWVPEDITGPQETVPQQVNGEWFTKYGTVVVSADDELGALSEALQWLKKEKYND